MHPNHVLASLLLSPALCLPLSAQKEPAAAKAGPDTAALATATKIPLAKAIDIARKAKPGIATTAELEATTDGTETVACYEVMLLGTDQVVYEVRVHAGTGKVLATELCTDAEDTAEVKAAAMLEHALPLARIASEAHGLLRGTCIGAELAAKKQRAEVTMWNHGRPVHAEFALADGSLLAAKCKPATGTKGDDDDDDDEAEEHDGAGEQHGGKKRESGDEDDDDEHEGGEAGEHHGTETPKPKRGA
ncbi:MAG: PepSY domain-containing protein [Planctomycetes bacterium]|nr:PepSY domain-containing protein [Planctomycetota bacterium]